MLVGAGPSVDGPGAARPPGIAIDVAILFDIINRSSSGSGIILWPGLHHTADVVLLTYFQFT